MCGMAGARRTGGGRRRCGIVRPLYGSDGGLGAFAATRTLGAPQKRLPVVEQRRQQHETGRHDPRSGQLPRRRPQLQPALPAHPPNRLRLVTVERLVALQPILRLRCRLQTSNVSTPTRKVHFH